MTEERESGGQRKENQDDGRKNLRMAGNGAGWQRNRGASTFLVIRRGFVSLLSFGGAHSFPMSSRGACCFSLRHPEEAKPTKDLFFLGPASLGKKILRFAQDDRGKRTRMTGGKSHRMTGERISGWRKKVRDGMERVQDNRGRVQDDRETEALALSV